MLACGISYPTTTHVLLAQTIRSLGPWVQFEQVPKDPVVSNCSLMCQKIGLCFTEGAELSYWSVEPVEVEAYITGMVSFERYET